MSTIVTLCRMPKCSESIPQWKLMCVAHWAMVPKAIQRRVFGTLTAYKERGTSVSQQQYLNAVADAVQTAQVAMDKKARATSAT